MYKGLNMQHLQNILWFLIIITQACSQAVPEKCKPHIIYFLVDDLGWNDVGFHGLTQIPTPNIDTLAANGVILNNYYTAPACSPSRSALMSGMYPTTTGFQHIVLMDPQRVGLGLEYKLLPQVLKDIGYSTHMVGKWHLGFYRPEYTPTRRGFDSHYGFWNGGSDHFYHTMDYSYQVRDKEYGSPVMLNVPDDEPRENVTFAGQTFRNGFKKVKGTTGKYLADLYTNYSVELIHKHNRREPLFLYLAHHGVHRGNANKPVVAPAKYTKLFTNIPDNEHSRKNFAGALTSIDRSLGEIMAALARNRMLKNTIFIFSSDNGAPEKGNMYFTGGSNYPLKGFKITGWEGGVRGNAFIWSPRLKTQGIYDGLMHIADWMPTLYKAAGQNNGSSLGKLDGHDLWDAISENTTSPRVDILLQSDPAPFANNFTSYRRGDYKIVSGSLEGRGSILNMHLGDNGRENPPEGFLTPEESQTSKVLKSFYRREPKYMTNPILVECGGNTTDASELCDPDSEVCLFNIKEDPCEYRNLAKQNPVLLEKLLQNLNSIKVKTPLFPKLDFLADPVYHSSYWSPWMDNASTKK